MVVVGRPVGLAERHDLAVLDADIADEARLAGAVDDRAACDLEVKATWLAPECPFIIRRLDASERKHMAKHKIALIPGDGIGKEVVPEGVRVLEAAGAALQLRARVHRFRLVVRPLRQDRQDDAGRRHGDAEGVREHLPRRRRLAGRARSRLAVGPADPDPPRLRRVREPAARAPVRGRADRRSPTASRARSTSGSCARTPRASTARSAAACSRAPTNEIAIQEAIFTRKGVDRVMKYAFEFAQHDARRST